MEEKLRAIAVAVLTEAGEKLQALGLPCTLSPLSLPQGMCFTLIVAESQIAGAAAYVAQGRGGAEAYERRNAHSFSEEVADVLAEEVISNAARRPS